MPTFKHDPFHSDIEFKIRHLMISTVKGSFSSFDVTLLSDEKDFSDAQIFCEVDVSTIYTGISDRDAHLRSADFFNVDEHPKMHFRSTEIERTSDEDYLIHGLLRIRGVEKQICLNGTYNGSDIDNYGQIKHGFDLIGKINRSDWDLDFNIAGGRNTLLIGDEVKMDISIQVVQIDE